MNPTLSTPDELADGRLAECPDRPNCVSSQSRAARRALPPIAYTGPASAALARLRALVEQQPRAVIVAAGEHYLHAEFRSRWFRFVDDVEFLIDARRKVIHFRSASRLGYWDLGANRRRIERLRILFREGTEATD
jgi:uncharacterized protein (DUF1499 family)